MAATLSESGQALKHVAIAIAEAPSPTFWTDAQWKAFYALADTVVPSIVGGQDEAAGSGDGYHLPEDEYDAHFQQMRGRMIKTPSRKAFEAYLAEKPSDVQGFRDHMTRTVLALPPSARAQLGTILWLLSTSYGSYPLTGWARPIYDLPVEARQAVMHSWEQSWMASLRGLAKSLNGLSRKIWVQTSPLWPRLSGYDDLPADYRAGAPAEYAFKQFARAGDGDGPVTLETDVVIVGSGCGGGVCARVLAEAGHRVLVVDKGYYFPPAQLPMRSDTADTNLFENGGVVASVDGSITLLAGSTWGGGGTVNWGVSLQTPGYVRQDWARNRGLAFFGTDAFQESLDRVCGFMGVSDAHVRQSHRGQVLLDGARKLGWAAKVTPHNSGGRDHHCGHCHLGCGSGGKQGPAVSWLPAAARAGAEFVEGFRVDRVDFGSFASGKKATGITGTWTSRDANGATSGPAAERYTREVVVKAKRVIVSCGTLSSPVLLKKSGLANPQIGRNLYLHPVNTLGAYWDEDTNPMDGCAISSVCTEFENLDGEGHGVALETISMVPYLVYANTTARSGIDFKLSALRYRNLNTFLCITKDRDTGRVYPDARTGRPVVEYTPSAFDRAHTLEGMVALARICRAAGAVEIQPSAAGAEPWVRTGDADADDAAFDRFLARMRAVGNDPTTAAWGCAHQMGSCRMARAEDEGVVDPQGRVWGVQGLYVADASVLPSATGVNPMVSTMATADWIARGVVADLAAVEAQKEA